jgi:hypothetical protein
MRAALTFVLVCIAIIAASAAPIPLPSEVKEGRWRMLDTSPRARVYASWFTVPVAKAQFRKMQQQYDPHAFDMWAKRLAGLKLGMTEKQVIAALRPKEVGAQLIQNPGFSDTMLLDDAYFADVFFSPWPHRMIYATTPLARSYEIKTDQKKQQKI